MFRGREKSPKIEFLVKIDIFYIFIIGINNNTFVL